MSAIVASGKNPLLPRVLADARNRRKEPMATQATTETFDTEVLKTDGKVIVDFWAEWCGPCHAVSPVLDRIADEHDVKLVKVNIDEQQDLAQRYGVASIPFMVLFENGEPQASAIGAMPKGSLEKALGLAAGEVWASSAPTFSAVGRGAIAFRASSSGRLRTRIPCT